MMTRAPFMQASKVKAYDHEDVTVEFQEDWVLAFLGVVSIMVGLAGVGLVLIVLHRYWS